MIGQLSRRATPTRSTATSTSASRASRTTERSPGSGPTRSRSRSRTRPRRIRATSALWKATKEGEDTFWESPWGVGPPGLAHRVLRDGREGARPGVLDPRRRARSRLPAPRERARAVARSRPSFRAHLDAQRDAAASRARRCRSRSATSRRSRTCSAEWGAETALVFFLTAPLAEADRLLADTMTAARAQAETLETRCAARRAPPATGPQLVEHARGRLQHAGRAGAVPRVGADRGSRRAAARAGPLRARRRSPHARTRPPRSIQLAEARVAARAARDFAEADRLRDEIATRGLGGA